MGAKHRNNSILEGNIWKNLVLFGIPIAISIVLQQLFTAADQAVVGNYAGSAALAAVGANASLIGLLVNVFASMSVGTNAQIARKIGAGRPEGISRMVHTSITFAGVIGVILLVFTQIIAGNVHVMLGTPDDVMDMAVSYIRIYAIGFPFILLYNFGSAVLRSVGDTKRPMIALTSAGVINVILNLIFVIAFGMGVNGVALATVISNVISSVTVIIILLKETGDIKLYPNKLGIDKSSIIEIIQIGGPAAIQSAVFSVANVSIQSGINSLGSTVMAGSVAAQNFEFMSYSVINSFCQATTTFCGQNYGAGKMDRCRKVIRVALVESMIAAFIFDIVCVIARQPLVGLFTQDAAVAEVAYERLFIALVPHCLIALYEVPGAAMRSMGYSLGPALLTIVGCVGFRVTWLFTIFALFHEFGVLIAVYPASWIFTFTLTLGYYFIKKNKMYGTLSEGKI